MPGFPLTRVCSAGVFVKSALSKFKEHFHFGFMVVRIMLMAMIRRMIMMMIMMVAAMVGIITNLLMGTDDNDPDEDVGHGEYDDGDRNSDEVH